MSRRLLATTGQLATRGLVEDGWEGYLVKNYFPHFMSGWVLLFGIGAFKGGLKGDELCRGAVRLADFGG